MPVVPGENSGSQDLNASAKFGGDPPASVEGKSREDSSAPAESAAAKQDSKADKPGDKSCAQELNASAKLGSDLPALVDGNLLTSREEISGPAEDSGNDLHGCKCRVSYLFLPTSFNLLTVICLPMSSYLLLPIYFGLPTHLPTYLFLSTSAYLLTYIPTSLTTYLFLTIATAAASVAESTAAGSDSIVSLVSHLIAKMHTGPVKKLDHKEAKQLAELLPPFVQGIQQYYPEDFQYQSSQMCQIEVSVHLSFFFYFIII
jgi:hypothetical protein